MPAELTKRVVRKTKSGIVVAIDENGVAMRLPHKKRWLRATWEQVAKAGFVNAGATLKAEEWLNPLNLLVRTNAVIRRGRKPKKKKETQDASAQSAP